MMTEEPGEPSSRQEDHPSPTRSRRGSNVYEATELTRIRKQYTHYSTIQRPISLPERPVGEFARFRYDILSSLSKFWRNQISVIVDHDTCRDHLALERTFLAYLRTSLAISMIGVVVAQLFRIQHSPTPSPLFGFFILGKPLACICQATAIYALLLGAYRTWRIQNAIIRGKTITGGIEVVLLFLGILLISILFFVLLIAVDATKEY